MRRFFEVFKTLKLPEDIGMYMENVEVTRVSKTSTNSLARVYIKNDRVISKKIIYRVEDALKKQIFRIQNMDVRIIDRYNLSKQYTPQTIMDVYYDSILFELEKYWTLEYNLLKNSTWEFEKDDLLVLTLEDGFLARTYADDLKEYFQLIFLNRFGFEIDVEYKYVAKLEKRYEKENEHKLNLRIKQIEDNFMAAGEEAKSDNGAEKNKKYAEQKAKAAAFFNERGRKMDATLKSVDESSQQVTVGSENLAQSAQELAEGATEQAGAVEELQATIATLTEQIADTADNLQKTSDKAVDHAKNADASKVEMHSLMEAMQRISDTSKKIENIISDIESIASQTNLLSLNAAIEAARAGEAGKGFAVVAEQIRMLADQSAQSAVDTRTLIEGALNEIEEGNTIAMKAVESIDSVVQGINDIADVSKQLSDNSNVQIAAMREAEKGIDQISEVVQSNSAASEECSATSEELSAQAEAMNELISQFTLRN